MYVLSELREAERGDLIVVNVDLGLVVAAAESAHRTVDPETAKQQSRGRNGCRKADRLATRRVVEKVHILMAERSPERIQPSRGVADFFQIARQGSFKRRLRYQSRHDLELTRVGHKKRTTGWSGNADKHFKHPIWA